MVAPSTHEVFEAVAEFTLSVIDSLRSSIDKNGRLLPREVLLNINYPALPRDQIKGVLHPEISAGNMIQLGYHRCAETGHLVFHSEVGEHQLRNNRVLAAILRKVSRCS